MFSFTKCNIFIDESIDITIKQNVLKIIDSTEFDVIENITDDLYIHILPQLNEDISKDWLMSLNDKAIPICCDYLLKEMESAYDVKNYHNILLACAKKVSCVMKGLRVSSTGLDVEHRECIRILIERMGGNFSSTFTESTTHLICDTVQSQKYRVAKTMKTILITEAWVYDCYNNGIRIIPKPDEYKTPLLKNYIISVTNFEPQEVDTLRSLIISHGGTFSPNLYEDCTHLICKYGGGSKYDNAHMFDVHVVRKAWLSKHISSEGAVDDKDFPVIDNNNNNLNNNNIVNSDKSGINNTDIIPNSLQNIQNEFKYDHNNNMYLKNCRIIIIGLNTIDNHKCMRIIRIGGGTRYKCVRPRITHVIASSLDIVKKQSKDTFTMINKYANIVSIDWLIECYNRKEEVDVDSYILEKQKIKLKATSSIPNKVKRPLTTKRQPTDTNINFADFYRTLDNENGGTHHNKKKSFIVKTESNNRKRLKTSSVKNNGMFNLSNERFLFYCRDLPFNVHVRITKCIRNEGGTNVDHMEEITDAIGKVDHHLFIVCEHRIPLDASTLMHHSPYLVTPKWIETCCTSRKVIDPFTKIAYLPWPAKTISAIPTFLELTISVSMFQRQERQMIQDLVKMSGASFTDGFRRGRNTHLICRTAEGTKYKKALQWNIPAVHWRWLYDSLVAGDVLNYDKYNISIFQSKIDNWKDIFNIMNNNVSENDNKLSKLNSLATTQPISTNAPISTQSIVQMNQQQQVLQKKRLPYIPETSILPLSGCRISISEAVIEIHPTLPSLTMQLGARLNNKDASHFIVTGDPKKRSMERRDWYNRTLPVACRIVSVEWINSCNEQQVAVPVEPYIVKLDISDTPPSSNSIVKLATSRSIVSRAAMRKADSALFHSSGMPSQGSSGPDEDGLVRTASQVLWEGRSASQQDWEHAARSRAIIEEENSRDALAQDAKDALLVLQEHVDKKNKDDDDDKMFNNDNDKNISLNDMKVNEELKMLNQQQQHNNNNDNSHDKIEDDQHSNSLEEIKEPSTKRRRISSRRMNKSRIPCFAFCSFSDDSLCGQYKTTLLNLGAKIDKQTKNSIFDCTHLIADSLIKNVKILTFMVSKKWILHPSYVLECFEAKKLIDEEAYSWSERDDLKSDDEKRLRDAIKKWRISEQLPFSEWKVFVCLNSDRQKGFINLLKAGGATVQTQQKFLSYSYDFAFFENEQDNTNDKRNTFFIRLSEKTICCRPEYIIDYMLNTKDQPLSINAYEIPVTLTSPTKRRRARKR